MRESWHDRNISCIGNAEFSMVKSYLIYHMTFLHANETEVFLRMALQ